ncbi:hypothetical protein Mapa_015585 [Marchantia paleacea]|nr:hypothetical protein Mapa_015585 [Marchantia paleacea]
MQSSVCMTKSRSSSSDPFLRAALAPSSVLPNLIDKISNTCYYYEKIAQERN